MENNQRDVLETILDSALHSYSQAEPLAGLEERILNRAGTANVKGSRPYLRSLVVASLLGVLCLGVFTLMRPKQIPLVTAAHKPPVPSLSALELPVRSPLQQVPTFRPRRPRQALAKQEQFPTPEPPTAEERNLMRFIERDPKQAAEAFASLQRKSDTPLAIEPLQVRPLQVDDLSN